VFQRELIIYLLDTDYSSPIGYKTTGLGRYMLHEHSYNNNNLQSNKMQNV